MLPLVSITTRSALAGTALALLLLLVAAPDAAADVDTLLDRMERREPTDLESAVALYAEAEGSAHAAKIRARLVKEVGALTKGRKTSLRVAALAALGRMGDRGAVRYLKPHIRPPRDAKRVALALAAIEAAAHVRDDALVASLLKVVDKSKNHQVAGAAVRTLAKFGDSKRYRKRILEELATTLRGDLPSAPKRGHVVGTKYIPGRHGSAGTERWVALSRIIPTALNELTGQSYGSVYEWMDLVRSHKRRLDDLFAKAE
jgi:hypothetical protein